jgi:hypothetical protein
MEIKFNIPDDKVDELRIGFLKAVPKPPELQHLSDLEYYVQWLKDSTLNAYRTGKILIAKEATEPVFENIIE